MFEQSYLIIALFSPSTPIETRLIAWGFAILTILCCVWWYRRFYSGKILKSSLVSPMKKPKNMAPDKPKYPIRDATPLGISPNATAKMPLNIPLTTTLVAKKATTPLAIGRHILSRILSCSRVLNQPRFIGTFKIIA
jgi:hypothetical protein